jgi:hypothetical protein
MLGSSVSQQALPLAQQNDPRDVPRGHVPGDGPSNHLEESSAAYQCTQPVALRVKQRGKPHTVLGGPCGTHAEELSPQEAHALVGAGAAPLWWSGDLSRSLPIPAPSALWPSTGLHGVGHNRAGPRKVAPPRDQTPIRYRKAFPRQPRGDTRETPEDQRLVILVARRAAEVKERRALFAANANAANLNLNLNLDLNLN